MRVLVLGASGLLGSNVVSAFGERGHDVIGVYHTSKPSFDVPLERADVREADRIHELFEQYSPTAVVNCAAMTDVDGCESAPDDAYSVNAEAPGEIASICEEADATFVHVSTDYVFDGTADRPYSESDDPNPRQVYGESKLAGERAVREVATEALVLRLSFVYGINRSTDELTGFPAWVLRGLRDGERTPLFTEQHVTPTRAGQAATTLIELLDHAASGTVHVACRSCVTPFEFGERIRQLIEGPPGLLVESSIDEVDRAARRPPYSCLDVRRVEDYLSRPQPTIGEDLSAVEGSFVRG